MSNRENDGAEHTARDYQPVFELLALVALALAVVSLFVQSVRFPTPIGEVSGTVMWVVLTAFAVCNVLMYLYLSRYSAGDPA